MGSWADDTFNSLFGRETYKYLRSYSATTQTRSLGIEHYLRTKDSDLFLKLPTTLKNSKNRS